VKRLIQQGPGPMDGEGIISSVEQSDVLDSLGVVVSGDYKTRYGVIGSELHLYFTEMRDEKLHVYYDFVIPSSGILEPVNPNEITARYYSAHTVVDAQASATQLDRDYGGHDGCASQLEPIKKFLGL